MSNLTAAKEDKRQNGQLVEVALSNVKVYKGSNISLKATGYAAGSGDTASEKYAGVAYETVDNSGGSAGDKGVRVYMTGAFSMGCTGADITWVGKAVYAVDDNIVALAATTTNDIQVGTVVKLVSATEVIVRVD